jgi:hypothetical protein
MLQGEMHIIRVGGDSYKEKRNRALIYEDAIMAVKNTIKHGITLAGNVSIYHAIKLNKPIIMDEILKEFESGTHNIMIGATEEKIVKTVKDILEIIAEGSLAAFKAVFDNAVRDKKYKTDIFRNLRNKTPARTFNLLKGDYESFPANKWQEVVLLLKMNRGKGTFDEKIADDLIPSLISPGNMDKEILRATFSILGLFLTSNQLITVHAKRDNKV